MRNLLSKHGIPTDTLSNAVVFLNEGPDVIARDFIAEFGMSLQGSDALSAARFAADAIFRGATAVDKVVGYVAKRMMGQAEKAVPEPVRVVMTGAPVVDSPEVTVVPVVSMAARDEAPAVVVKGRRGRKRLGNSDFAKVVSIIEANPGVDRQTAIDCIVAAGIKETSAAVYLWRYHTKGERE